MKLSCRIATPAKQGTVRLFLKTYMYWMYLNSIDISSIPGIGLKGSPKPRISDEYYRKLSILGGFTNEDKILSRRVLY